MAAGYSYVLTAEQGSILFPGLSFDPTMTFETDSAVGGFATGVPSNGYTPPPPMLAASVVPTGFSPNIAILLIVVGIALVVFGGER